MADRPAKLLAGEQKPATMGDAEKLKWTARPAALVVLRYGLAFASVAAALGVARIFLYFHLPQPFATFALTAIALTFWYGGTKPGILSAVLACTVRIYLFEPEVSTVSRVCITLSF